MKSNRIIGAVLAAVLLAAVDSGRASEPKPGRLGFASVATEPPPAFSYDDYAAVLNSYVDEQGLVDYKSLQANREKLDAFATALAKLEPPIYENWSAPEKIAFWINAYNALTLEAIINHYPIKASFFKSLLFPKNSIRQIPGVWDKLQFEVMGRPMTLDEIEHEVLRKQFNEPRIHMALVCAALGCPPLRNEPFTGARLDEQLDDQTRRFLAHPRQFRIDRSQNRVFLSSIFKWFGGDFTKTYGTEEKFAGREPGERAVLNFVSPYLEPADRNYLGTGKYAIKYLDYDWSLNEQTGD